MTSLNMFPGVSFGAKAPTMRPHANFGGRPTSQPLFSGNSESEQPRPKQNRARKLLFPLLLLGGLAGGGLALTGGNPVDYAKNWLNCLDKKLMFPDAEVHCNNRTGGILVDITPKEFRSPQ